jgi:hypothetical protein
MQSRIIALAVANSLLAWTACAVDGGPAPSAPVAEFSQGDLIDIDHVEARSEPALVLAEILAPDGATLIFINEGEPGGEPVIGVEILSATSTPVTDGLLAQHPSALELFLATAAGAAAPGELVRDHERLAAGSADYSIAPRTLLVLQAQAETSGYYDCANTHAWAADFGGWAPTLAGEYIQTSEQGSKSGYVGYAYKFYFDVCRPWDVAPTYTYYTGVFRRPGSNYDWVRINSKTDALNYQQRRWRYYRNTLTCTSYQYQMRVSSGSGYYHRAARWSEEWSCQRSS